jgi:amino acid adenylation domain-containing protein/FkbM family methyltransferase
LSVVMQTEIIEGFQLSAQQKRVWLLRQREGSARCSQVVLRLDGELRKERLRQAVEMVVRRHEALRTTFHLLPGLKIPVQMIAGEAQVDWREQDLRGLEQTKFEASRRALLAEEEARDFDIDRGPLLHAVLMAVSERSHLLSMTLPSLCADTWSLKVLAGEVSNYYAAETGAATGDEEPLPYAQYAAWQTELMAGPESEEGRAYWREAASAAALDLSLPFEREVSCTNNTTLCAHLLRIERELTSRISALCQRQSAPLDIFLLACWQTLLWRLAGGAEFTMAVAHDGRGYKELQNTIGPVAKYLPQRLEPRSDLPFNEFLAQAHQATQAVANWQEFFDVESFGEAAAGDLERLRWPVGYEFSPPFGVISAGDLTFTPDLWSANIERFKLKLVCWGERDELFAAFEYDAGRFNLGDVERLGERFGALLESVCRRPTDTLRRLILTGAAERGRLLVEFNSASADFRQELCVHQLIEAQAKGTPNRIAVRHGQDQLTYDELDARSNQLARYLGRFGVGPAVSAGIYLESSIDMIIGILAVLKAGAAYVPLDPTCPQDRLAFMLADAQISVLLTQSRFQAELREQCASVVCLDQEREAIDLESAAPPVTVAALSAAYVIYTSGSTGRPKGVVVTHQNLAHSTAARFCYYDEPVENFLLTSPPVFDSSVAGIFWTLCQGGALTLPAVSFQQSLSGLFDLIGGGGVSHLLCVPSLYRLILEQSPPELLKHLRQVIVAGEACPMRLVERHYEVLPNVSLYNEYGPTEATVWSSVYKFAPGEAGGVAPIGRPISHTKIYLLDEDFQPAPLGLAGEIFIGGAGISRGYLNLPGLTAEKFLPHPFNDRPDERVYRTGDLARYRDDGVIEFLGRVDHQVKINGYRIELGEIENVLEQHHAIRRAVVMAVERAPGGPRLVSYLSPDPQSALPVSRILRLQAEGRLNGRGRYSLPNGLEIIHHNQNETEYLYQDLFEREVYLQNGITLAEGDCVFDVGANIGLFTLLVHRRCPGCVIYAFEPIKPIFEILGLNVSIHGIDATAFNCGLSSRSGSETFTYYPRLSLMSGRYADTSRDREVVRAYESRRRPVGPLGGTERDGKLFDELLTQRLTGQEMTCQLKTVSEVMRENGIERIDLLKIDVEKSEEDVLLGIEEADWPKIKQLVIEAEGAGGSLERITGLLERHAYNLTVRQEDGADVTGLHIIYAVRPATQAAVPATPDRRPGRRSGAVWSDSGLLLDDVRGFLKARLPAQMIPVAYTLLDELPLTPNGKVDRRALTMLEDGATLNRTYVAPRTEAESFLADIWREVLGVEQVGVHDSFFELGGDSIKGIVLINRVQEKLGENVQMVALLESPRIADLAAYLSRRYPEAMSRRQVARRAEWQVLSAETRGDVGSGSSPSSALGECESESPLSFAQRRLWFLSQLEPDASTYNIPGAARLEGELDVMALRRSFNELARRHEILRMSFPSRDGRPMQDLSPDLDLALPQFDLASLPPEEQSVQVRRLMIEESHKPFDVGAGPLFRAALMRLSALDHILLVTTHHIISDGWSVEILIRELASLYASISRGAPPRLPALQAQYSDFARWQRQRLQGEFLERQLAYWRRQLSGAPAALALPTDYPRPAFQTYNGATYSFSLPRQLLEGLGAVGRGEDATLFMILLAAFNLLLHCHTGQEDIVVGTDVANRNRAELEGLIGFFVNQLVLRTTLGPDMSFRSLLAGVREVALGAYAHQDVPFDMVVESLNLERDPSRNPLFQVLFVLHHRPSTPAAESLGLRTSLIETEIRTSAFDISLHMVEATGGLTGSFRYNTDLFKEATIARLSEHFSLLLERIAARPDAGVSDLKRMLADADDEETALKERTRQESVRQKYRTAKRKPVQEDSKKKMDNTGE